jgi:predicted XRE-type DNA-binding protein
LGLPDADELFWKASLVAEISRIIEAKALSQMEVSRLSGLHQTEVSRLLRGKLSSFSVERILRVLNRLGHSVELRISRDERPDASTVVLVA